MISICIPIYNFNVVNLVITIINQGEESKKPYEVAWWQPYRQLQEEGIKEEDSRIRGPALTTFPHTAGWKIDAEGIALDELTIKKITYHFTQRIFRPLGERARPPLVPFALDQLQVAVVDDRLLAGWLPGLDGLDDGLAALRGRERHVLGLGLAQQVGQRALRHRHAAVVPGDLHS